MSSNSKGHHNSGGCKSLLKLLLNFCGLSKSPQAPVTGNLSLSTAAAQIPFGHPHWDTCRLGGVTHRVPCLANVIHVQLMLFTTGEPWAIKGFIFPPCRFGSFVYSRQTGIILNNELADFCIANRSIKAGEHPHPQNKAQDQGMDTQAVYKWVETACKLIGTLSFLKSG